LIALFWVIGEALFMSAPIFFHNGWFFRISHWCIKRAKIKIYYVLGLRERIGLSCAF